MCPDYDISLRFTLAFFRLLNKAQQFFSQHFLPLPSTKATLWQFVPFSWTINRPTCTRNAGRCLHSSYWLSHMQFLFIKKVQGFRIRMKKTERSQTCARWREIKVEIARDINKLYKCKGTKYLIYFFFSPYSSHFVDCSFTLVGDLKGVRDVYGRNIKWNEVRFHEGFFRYDFSV